MLKILLFFICGLISINQPKADPDFRTIFGTNYSWAVNWIKEHHNQLNKYAVEFNLPQKELESIVFPELIRYNRVFDAIQIESLKYLYVTEGKTYADFSVGYFQMKPSFAEIVEKDAVKICDSLFKYKSNFSSWAGAADNSESRKARVNRITNIDQQIIYLCAFYKICENKFATRHFDSAIEKLRFFATCYNAGYQRNASDILSFQNKKHYYNYNYSSVSAYYYEQNN